MQKLKLTIIFLFIIVLVGCTPILVKEDEPIILNNSTGLSENQMLLSDAANSENEVLIKGINSNLIDGLIYDISDDSETLLIGSSSSSSSDNKIESATSYSNLYTYNIQNNQLKQIISSPKEQINAVFDKRNRGMIYVEYNKDKDGKAVNDSYKLNWTDYEGDTSKNISLSDESVSPKFSLVNDNFIIYGNSKGQIKTVEARNIPKDRITPKTYNLSEPLNIYKIDYYEYYDLAVFLAVNPKTKHMDLYYVLLNDSEVNPTLLQQNVTDFNISTKNKSILYNVNGEKGNQLVIADILHYNKTILYEGPVSMFYYTPDEDKIIYGEKVDDSSNTQNLWIMKSDGSNGMQIASNLKIAGNNLIFPEDEDAVFFSVFQLADKESNELSYKVYMIEFSYSR